MSASAVSQKLPRPQLRGLFHQRTKIHLVTSVVLSILAGVTYKYTVGEPRKKKYAEFYKNYDADQDFERMRKLGLFSSCPADD
ncbi:cytochrome c oxidase subunit 6C-like [Daktulosphaira vitifoliae]|uniref:cytochrome c oxidase subunit 6C-like n=1 Tax=Daktulosphaira vitifoliae TaxID=58002 RepID=UPI0021AA6ACE|nr:cytochrome c oxidase subunit 6C-like [Daktulosphaira vitifoliae]